MSNYFPSSGYVLLLVSSIIATLTVALRFWARRIRKIRLELNDYLIVLGLVFALAEVIVDIYGSPSSLTLKMHWSANDPIDAGNYQAAYSLVSKLFFISHILWAIAVTLIRSSIILLYIRIFPARPFRLTCYAVLTLNGTFFISSIIDQCLLCTPVSCRWDSRIRCSYCDNQKIIDLFNASINLLLDITLVILPTPVLWGLQMAVSKKATLSGMFGLGILTCAITADRLQKTTTVSPVGNDYVNKTTPTLAFLKCLEAILGVLNACLPVLKPVFSKFRDSMKKLCGSEIRSRSLKCGSIPMFMRVKHMWKSRSRNRAGREELDSIISMEDLRRNQNVVQSTSKAERVVGTKVFEIHVQRDVHVESSSCED